MESIKVSISDIKSLPRLNISHYESDILINGDELYKIIHPSFIHGREIIIEELNTLNIEGTVVPKTKLYYDSKNKSIFYGYIMHYYKEYITLKEIFNQDISYQERINIINRINSIYRKILELGFNYWDIKPTNILTNGNDVVYVDMDSIHRMKDIDIYEFDTREKLFMLSLSILLGKNSYEIKRHLRIGNSIERFICTLTNNSELREVLSSIYYERANKEYNYGNMAEYMRLSQYNGSYYFDECVAEFSEQRVNESNKLLQKKHQQHN